MMVFGWALATFAMLIVLVAAVGVLRLPDALSRQHAATKAATLGVGLFACALILAATASGWGWGWTVRLAVMILILICALPLASHALARAGLVESNSEDE